MSRVIKGKIEATTKERKWGFYGFKIGDEWYNRKNKHKDLAWGNTVKVKVKKSGKKLIIVCIKLLKKSKKGEGGG